MKRQLTEIEKLEEKIHKLKLQKEEFENYVKKHKSLSFDKIRTCDTKKLKEIYKYFDKKYPIDWQGGLRNDNRGMRLFSWFYDKGDYLNLHLTSDHDDLYFSGSTSWLVYAPTLEEKIEVLKQIKKDMLNILEK